jgi:acetyl esterase/lipase
MKLIALLLCVLRTAGSPAQGPQPDVQHPPINPEFIALPAAQSAAAVVEHKNITYVQASGTDLQLDVYPQRDNRPAPVVVYFHGGAWWKNARPVSAGGFREAEAERENSLLPSRPQD